LVIASSRQKILDLCALRPLGEPVRTTDANHQTALRASAQMLWPLPGAQLLQRAVQPAPAQQSPLVLLLAAAAATA